MSANISTVVAKITMKASVNTSSVGLSGQPENEKEGHSYVKVRPVKKEVFYPKPFTYKLLPENDLKSIKWLVDAAVWQHFVSAG